MNYHDDYYSSRIGCNNKVGSCLGVGGFSDRVHLLFRLTIYWMTVSPIAKLYSQIQFCKKPRLKNRGLGVKRFKKGNLALTANRTRGRSMATIEVTTTPLMLCCNVGRKNLLYTLPPGPPIRGIPPPENHHRLLS